jgi:hypothetical protein
VRAAGVRAAVRGDNQPRFEPTWLLEPVPLPEQRPEPRPGSRLTEPGKVPGFLYLFSGPKPATPTGLPFEMLDLGGEPSDRAAWYALFRLYLFDYRTDLTLPFLLLVDQRGLAHKVYPAIPEAGVLHADLKMLQDPNRLRRALPFPGRYYTPPHRNYFRLGAAFYWAGYPDQALIYLEEAVRSAPDNSKSQLAIGHIHLWAGAGAPGAGRQAEPRLRRRLDQPGEPGDSGGELRCRVARL